MSMESSGNRDKCVQSRGLYWRDQWLETHAGEFTRYRMCLLEVQGQI